MNMDMDMTSGSSGTSSMGSSSMGMNMGGMNMDSGAGMQSMSFFSSTSTSLYVRIWTPTGPAGYAATCIFLISLAIISKGLVVVKARLEAHWKDTDFERQYPELGSNGFSESEFKDDALKVPKRSVSYKSWRPCVDPVRAVMDTVSAGIGFLLMLAVMTMNIGYFISVLGGIFIGSLAFGRFSN
ncbi:hypothetical protein K3495_g13083 [Podosphaera aphanis]|nr:hypothetical protein K3495_g13083 [Podosphaera aphanis]